MQDNQAEISIAPTFITLHEDQMRHFFDIPDSITYLNCAYLSPDLKAVTEAARISAPKRLSLANASSV